MPVFYVFMQPDPDSGLPSAAAPYASVDIIADSAEDAVRDFEEAQAERIEESEDPEEMAAELEGWRTIAYEVGRPSVTIDVVEPTDQPFYFDVLVDGTRTAELHLYIQADTGEGIWRLQRAIGMLAALMTSAWPINFYDPPYPTAATTAIRAALEKAVAN